MHNYSEKKKEFKEMSILIKNEESVLDTNDEKR